MRLNLLIFVLQVIFGLVSGQNYGGSNYRPNYSPYNRFQPPYGSRPPFNQQANPQNDPSNPYGQQSNSPYSPNPSPFGQPNAYGQNPAAFPNQQNSPFPANPQLFGQPNPPQYPPMNSPFGQNPNQQQAQNFPPDTNNTPPSSENPTTPSPFPGLSPRLASLLLGLRRNRPQTQFSNSPQIEPPVMPPDIPATPQSITPAVAEVYPPVYQNAQSATTPPTVMQPGQQVNSYPAPFFTSPPVDFQNTQSSVNPMGSVADIPQDSTNPTPLDSQFPSQQPSPLSPTDNPLQRFLASLRNRSRPPPQNTPSPTLADAIQNPSPQQSTQKQDVIPPQVLISNPPIQTFNYPSSQNSQNANAPPEFPLAQSDSGTPFSPPQDQTDDEDDSEESEEKTSEPTKMEEKSADTVTTTEAEEPAASSPDGQTSTDDDASTQEAGKKSSQGSEDHTTEAPTPESCADYESFYECRPEYVNTCHNLARNDAYEKETCKKGCFCKEGTVKDYKGNCILPEDCPEPSCDSLEIWTPCINPCNTCRAQCTKDRCQIDECKSGCDCKDGYHRDHKGKCILAKNCPACSSITNSNSTA